MADPNTNPAILNSFAAAVAVVISTVLFCPMLMFFWNKVMPDMFGLPEINFWTAVSLFWMAQMLNGNIFSIASAFVKPQP